MKNWILVFFVLLSQNAFSQNSFKVQVDTSIKFPFDSWFIITPKIIGCVDGGIVIAGITKPAVGFNDESFILKTDSNGVLEWFNKYIVADPNFYGLSITQDETGNFYLSSMIWDGAVADYSLPRIQKINKFGAIQQTRYPASPTGGYEGHSLGFYSVEKNNGNLHGEGRHWGYDSNTDEPCCYSTFRFKCDSNLNILSKYYGDYLLYDSLDIPYYAIKTTGFNNQTFGIELRDTSGLQLETHFYSYDSTLMNYNRTEDLIQIENGFVMVDLVEINSKLRIAIHKVDLQWNTINYTVLDSINNGPFNATYGNSEIDINSNKGLYFTTLHSNGNLYPFNNSAVMLEIDSIGNIYNIWSSSDTCYLDNSIDTLTKSALFIKATPLTSNHWFNAEFQKEYFSAPSCGMFPATINSFQISITDSSNNDTASFSQGYFPFFTNYSFPVLAASTPVLTPLCGVLSGNQEPDPNGSCVPSIYPNPANDKINIIFNCEINQKAEVKIFNIIGDEVFSKSISTSNYENIFDVSKLPAGIYLVKSQSGDQAVFNSKIVIQK